MNDISRIISNINVIKKYFSNSKILITGANGLIGSYLVKVLSQITKYKIECIDIEKNNLISVNSKIIFHKVDLSKKDFKLPKKNYDLIIHNAGIPSPFYYRKDPLKTIDLAVGSTRRILENFCNKDTKFIFMSSSEIYGNPDKNNIPTNENFKGYVSPQGPRACYDESKRLGETLCNIFYNHNNIHTNVIRPFNVYGPGMRKYDYRVLPNFFNAIINNEPIKVYGSGNQTRTFCYITDFIEGVLRVSALGVPGATYNIGMDKEEITMNELALKISKVLNKKLLIHNIEYPDSYPTDEPMRRCPDITKARKQLDFKPKIYLDEGLEIFWKWWKKNQ